VSPLPDQMTNRWRVRPDPAPGEAQLYWHILMRDQPQVCALAATARERLADFSGLHFTPERWLHLTIRKIGPASDHAPAAINAMITQVGQQLAEISPVALTLGRVLYHPEAITLGVDPPDALDQVALVIQNATTCALAWPREATTGSWLPHITVAYGTQEQPAAPIISALGRDLPRCSITVDTIHLITQHGSERSWNWQTAATTQLSRTSASGHAGSSATAQR
jgi:2'-5' RNA ligase